MNHLLYTIPICLLLWTCSCKTKKQNTGEVTTESATASDAGTVGLNLGNKAPEISLKNFSDSTIALSSVKEKLVLVDFWASWCGPCRIENPMVVAAYQKYKDKKFKGGKGFTIYSVSLDNNREAWLKAITKDNLAWPYHVSDLKGWGSQVVRTYDIQGIPTNVLINNQGVIVAKNLRGEGLEETLEKLLVKE